MNRQAYIAELTQLLYYMTPWDREATIADYDKRLAEAEDVDALISEIGTPMKVAVTLNRGYTPSPKPDPNAPKLAPEPEPLPEAESPAAEELIQAQPQEGAEEPRSPAQMQAAAEELSPPVHTEPVLPEPPAQEAAAEVGAVEITTVEQAEAEPAAQAPDIPVAPGEEGIFSEIFTAATQAQSAVAMETAAKRRSPRPGVLIPYVIFSIILGIPVALALLAVDLLIFALALASLAGGICLAVCLFSAGIAGLGNRLVVLGLAVLSMTASVALSALGVWFMQNAVTGFVGFLVRFGQEHGYREEGSV